MLNRIGGLTWGGEQHDEERLWVLNNIGVCSGGDEQSNIACLLLGRFTTLWVCSWDAEQHWGSALGVLNNIGRRPFEY